MSRGTLKLGIGALAAASMFCLEGEQTRATVITLNGNTIVSDTYEGDTVGSPVVADTGNWDASNGNFVWFPRTLAPVTDAVSPGAFTGSQYAVMGAGPDSNNHLTASMTLAVGDVVKFDSMAYIPSATSAVSFPFQFMVIGAPAIDGNTVALANRLVDFYRNSDGTWSTSGVAGSYAGPTSYAADTWQHWEFEYTVGAAAGTLTIDGVSASIPSANTSLSGSNGLLTIISNYGASQPSLPYYFDNVPEPATATLLGIGLAVLSGRRRFRL